MPTCAGDRGRGEPVVAGDHQDPDAGARGSARPRRRTSGRGGSSIATSPRRRSSRSASSRSAGDRARPAPGRSATASTRRPLRGHRVDRARARRGDRPRSCGARRRRRRRSGQRGQQRLRGALDVHPAAVVAVVDRRHACAGRGRSGTWRAGRRRAGRRRRPPRAPRAAVEQRQLGGVADARPASGRVDAAVLHAAAAPRRAGRARAPPSSARARRATSPAASRRPRPHPVLGQRAGLVGADDRRSSRASRRRDSRLTSAPARASAADAHRQGEGDGRQQALGHVGHQQADGEDRRRRASGRPGREQRPAAGTRGPRPTATAAISQATRRTCALQRALGSRAPRCDSAAIRPSSVRMPVAWTTADGLAAGAQRCR